MCNAPDIPMNLSFRREVLECARALVLSKAAEDRRSPKRWREIRGPRALLKPWKFSQGPSGRRSVDGAAIDHGLQQRFVEWIGPRLDGLRGLAFVAEFCADRRVEEVSARNEFGEDAKRCGIIALKFGD